MRASSSEPDIRLQCFFDRFAGTGCSVGEGDGDSAVTSRLIDDAPIHQFYHEPHPYLCRIALVGELIVDQSSFSVVELQHVARPIRRPEDTRRFLSDVAHAALLWYGNVAV